MIPDELERPLNMITENQAMSSLLFKLLGNLLNLSNA
jgi:hypothetical protein